MLVGGGDLGDTTRLEETIWAGPGERSDHRAWGALRPPTGLTNPTVSASILQQPQENGKEQGNFSRIKYTKNIPICSQYKHY